MDNQPSPPKIKTKLKKSTKWTLATIVALVAVFAFVGGSEDEVSNELPAVTPPAAEQQQGTVKGESIEVDEILDVVEEVVNEVKEEPIVQEIVETQEIQAPAPEPALVPEPTPIIIPELEPVPDPAPTLIIPTSSIPEPESTQTYIPEPTTTCCKVCRKGKACGDSCIKRSYTCHKGLGCACNAY